MQKIQPDASFIAFLVYKAREDNPSLNIEVINGPNYALIRETNKNLSSNDLIQIFISSMLKFAVCYYGVFPEMLSEIENTFEEMKKTVLSVETIENVEYLKINKWDLTF